ncbi:MAG: aldose 1-epimerase family protein [Lachnospiraceae bacterium]|nr:aldose 1-epimerase family protein [Lachnospiraceae bacterium]
MSRFVLENEWIKLEVESFGAEIKSLQRKSDAREYMWCGDKQYWGRTSPVLFPFVGSVSEGVYRRQGKAYPMGQHGFARDMEFTLVEQSKDTLWFELKSNEETLAKYPFDFVLSLGYKLEEKAVHVLWKVFNPSTETMYFSIGGHPAFMCPILENTKQTDYYIHFDTDKTLQSDSFEGALMTDDIREYPLTDGYLKIAEDLFDGDALVMEDGQVHEVALCLPDKTPYLTVKFDMPLVGIWSPTKKNAPFICIEPWYGRADKKGFVGDLSEREWGNTLKAKECFEASYVIEV